MKKRVLSLIMAVVILSSLGTSVFASGLSDLTEKDWYYNEVREMVAEGYITGYTDGTFQGQKSTTLAEFVTIIARMLGTPTGGNSSHWAGVQMDYALSKSWIDSYDLSLVGYDQPVTRQLAAKIIVAALELTDSHTPAHALPYNDFEAIDEAYRHYVQEAYHYGLFIGNTDGGFHPDEALIRGAAATVIYRSVKNVSDVYDSYTTQEIIDYFIEVGMYSEYDAYGNPGGSHPIVKWTSPISVAMSGNYTEEDVLLLSALMDELDSIDGFPGFYTVSDYASASMRMRFAMADEMNYVQGFYNPSFDGYFTAWWWNSTLSIYDAQIYYRAENLEQYYRNPTLCEELLQALGLMNDSYAYPDSLFYEPYNTVQWPSDLDWVIVELLYDPAIYPGMSEYECRAVLADILANK